MLSSELLVVQHANRQYSNYNVSVPTNFPSYPTVCKIFATRWTDRPGRKRTPFSRARERTSSWGRTSSSASPPPTTTVSSSLPLSTQSDLLLHHNITISRDRKGHHYLFHHSFVPGSSVRQYLGDVSFVSSISRLSGMMSLVTTFFASLRSILASESFPTMLGTPCPHHGSSPENGDSTGSTSECS